MKDQVPFEFLLFMTGQLMPNDANMTKTHIISLKAGKEIQHNLLEFSIGCLGDLTIGPANKNTTDQNQQKFKRKINVFRSKTYLMADSRSWCWLRMCCRKAFSNLVILFGSILSR